VPSLKAKQISLSHKSSGGISLGGHLPAVSKKKEKERKRKEKAGLFPQGSTWLSPVVGLPVPAPFIAATSAAAARSLWQGQSRASCAPASVRAFLLVSPASWLLSSLPLPSHPS